MRVAWHSPSVKGGAHAPLSSRHYYREETNVRRAIKFFKSRIIYTREKEMAEFNCRWT